MPWGSIISGGASLLSGLMGADAAGDAADTQAAATREGIKEQKRQYDLNRADLAPWRDTGSAAQRRLAQLLGLDVGGGRQGDYIPGGMSKSLDALLKDYDQAHIRDHGMTLQESVDRGFTSRADYARILDNLKAQSQGISGEPERPSDFGALNKRFSVADMEADPVYQSGLKFGLDQGTGAINARAVAQGGYDSGATLKALTRFATDYGSTKANESRNRFVADQDTTFNRLSGVSGSGQTATGQTVAAGTSGSNSMTDLITGGGNARAAGIVGGANAWSGAAGGINNAVNNYQSSEFLKRLVKNQNLNNYVAQNQSYGGGWEYGNDWY